MSSQILNPGTTYPAVVGRVIIQLRDKLNLRQAELAEAVGVTQATWSRVENGTSALTIEQLELAAEKLKTQPSQILKYAELATTQLRVQGVHVERKRISEGGTSGIALIGAAALGAIIAAALIGRK